MASEKNVTHNQDVKGAMKIKNKQVNEKKRNNTKDNKTKQESDLLAT